MVTPICITIRNDELEMKTGPVSELKEKNKKAVLFSNVCSDFRKGSVGVHVSN